MHFDLGPQRGDRGDRPRRRCRCPQQHARYYPADHEPLRTDLKPLEITQPEGPSFTVDGNLVRWSRWSFRIGFDPYEGLALHQVAYDDHGRERTILHRASVSEMVVPYGDPGPLHGWKNAFDAGEWGLGRMTQPLTLGCDCLGEIHYFDAVLASETGDPYTIENAICLHEEDYGILWKHVDLFSGTSEVRRSRRLVVNTIATVGNYEYAFSWYLYLDGNIQLEVKLTGIVSPMAIEPGTHARVRERRRARRRRAAPPAPVQRPARLRRRRDRQRGLRGRGRDDAVRAATTRGATRSVRTRRGSSPRPRAQRKTNSATSRCWKVVNPHVLNGLGQPVAYKLVPTMSTPTLLAQPDSSVGKRAGFAQHNLWVTPYSPDERRAAGEHPNQHEGGDGLPRWTAQDRNLVDTDIVLWYTFGVTHFVRPEDWPVMPVEYAGFLLTPIGFFDRNPALDLPPTDATATPPPTPTHPPPFWRHLPTVCRG